MIELTINDKKVETPRGSTILEAARANNIFIPTLCFDRRLKPYGGCRLCVVEIEGQKGLSASCATQARDGMVVYTATPKVTNSRKAVLEFLLLHHPLDCGICDKAGECKLQDYAFRYGPSQSKFSAAKKHDEERIDAPIVERNPNRCILCGICVRVCQDHQGVGAINFIGRGFETKISPAFEETLDCEFCGQCVDACPVGALGSKPYRYRSRVWFMDEYEMICPYCGCGCTTNLSLREGKIIRARGKEGAGINDGNLCSRGRFGFDYIYGDNRLKTPLLKKDGNLVAVSWEEAFAFVSQRLGEVRRKYGPSALGAIGSQRCTLEDSYMFQQFMRKAAGTDNIDSAARFGYSKAQKAMEMAFGRPFMPISWDSPTKADFILVVESDITSALPVWGLNFIIAKKSGAQLVVADSKETKLVRNSSRWLRLAPGSGVSFINGIMKVIFEEGLYDKGKVSAVENFGSLETTLKGIALSEISRTTGLSEDEIREIARAYAGSQRRLIALTSGSAENTKSINTFLAAANLVLLMGDSPESLQIPAEFSNTLGMWTVGVRPLREGKSAHEMFYQPGDIKAMYIMGENPAVSFPDVSTVEKTLKGLELLIVQDIFLTETARLADVVFPASSWAEKEGTFMSATGAVQRIPKLVAETGESIPDWMIFRNLGRLMGSDLGVSDLNEIRSEIKKAIESANAGGIRLSFSPASYRVGEPKSAEYPLSLVTANVMQHSGALSVLSKNLDSVVRDAYLQINTKDARKYGIEDESFVRVTSKRGEIYLKAMVSEEVPEETVFAPIHFAHAKVNSLTYPSVNGEVPLVRVKIEAAQ
ncbi:MAG TPA: molybdopterin-dependent oxidoreductase [Thermodesulfovibrionales bacterium]|nr:molybdopterin-dependent oxidoreductase [Thermodesulfovibrionales bacterium]